VDCGWWMVGWTIQSLLSTARIFARIKKRCKQTRQQICVLPVGPKTRAVFVTVVSRTRELLAINAALVRQPVLVVVRARAALFPAFRERHAPSRCTGDHIADTAI
jgi:hypothetical protein